MSSLISMEKIEFMQTFIVQYCKAAYIKLSYSENKESSYKTTWTICDLPGV